jgi:sulfocyanin
MKREHTLAFALVLMLAACGGGEPATDEGAPAGGAEPEPAAEASLTMPSWYQHDAGANAVSLDIVAGSTDANNYWNFNGYSSGNATVVVPVGATVTVNFSNQDPNMAHSIGVASFTSNPPAMLDPTPVFDGAITSNAADMMNATGTGESETISFTADTAGDYSLACYVAGHAVAGMWIHFQVSDAGEAGVLESM